MKQIAKQFSVAFAAGHSGSSTQFATFNVPSGVYRVEVFSQGGGSDASISIDQTSLYYQYYNASDQPVVFSLVSVLDGVISFHCTASTNNASTSTGVIFITPVSLVV